MYSYDLTNCFEDKIGKTGLSKSEYSQTLQDSITIIDEMRSDYESGKFPILNITNKKSDLEEINSTANYLRSNFDMLVVIGTGGSTLNPQIFAGFSDNAEKVIFIDHTDSQLTKRTLEKLDLKRTAFLSISKSGGTIETIAQTLICLGFVKKNYPKNYNKNFFFIIEPKKSYLRDLATSINSIILEHDTQIGGRFSGLTNVGLLVASYLGFDIEKIRQGAKNAIENDFFNYDVSNASKSAVLMFCLMQKNISTTVMMPYLASFKNFGVWYQQIWAESLGKEGKGSTPILATGSLDQHSQLQLYLDGPKDKVLTLITSSKPSEELVIEQPLDDNKEFDYLDGKMLSDVNNALYEGTNGSLLKNSCPTRKIIIDDINEELIGALMINFILETLVTAKLLKINAFDQPAVESGKIIAKKILSLKS